MREQREKINVKCPHCQAVFDAYDQMPDVTSEIESWLDKQNKRIDKLLEG